MIAHSNILNEIFRGKFSHNRDHCSPPPAASPCEGGWQLGTTLLMGLAQGQDGVGAPGFLGAWSRGQRVSAVQLKLSLQAGGVPLSPMKGEVAAALQRENTDNCSL